LRRGLSETFECAGKKKNGGGYESLCEPQGIAGVRSYTIRWRDEPLKIDLTELARKRWVEKWRIERIAKHFNMSRTMVCERLKALKASPALCTDTRVRKLITRQSGCFRGAV
jgi:hypothetical protein